MSYTNLTTEQVAASTNFFNSLDTDGDGSVTLQSMYDKSHEYFNRTPIYDERTGHTPSWVIVFQMTNGLMMDTVITLEQFIEYSTNTPELQISDFAEISKGEETITYEQLMKYYTPPKEIITVKSSCEYWIEELMEKESLNLQSQLTLQQLLEYENIYNKMTMKFWPTLN
jgi:Ca2+-binding EF-hand superfamily protein